MLFRSVMSDEKSLAILSPENTFPVQTNCTEPSHALKSLVLSSVKPQPSTNHRLPSSILHDDNRSTTLIWLFSYYKLTCDAMHGPSSLISGPSATNSTYEQSQKHWIVEIIATKILMCLLLPIRMRGRIYRVAQARSDTE